MQGESSKDDLGAKPKRRDFVGSLAGTTEVSHRVYAISGFSELQFDATATGCRSRRRREFIFYNGQRV
jgi:hypothetical protein